jgi:hypothetical protein
VTLLRESQYGLTKYVFGAAHATPKGMGLTMKDGFGRLSWLIEIEILNGVLGVECVPRLDARELPLKRYLLGGQGARRAT